MKIIVVGAGIGGLSTVLALSHKLTGIIPNLEITLLESQPTLAEIGAGVQMTPNAIRQLYSWGLKEDLLSTSAFPSHMHIHSGDDGSLLARVPFSGFDSLYHAPYLLIHRAFLHSILHKHCLKRPNIKILTSSRVTSYSFSIGQVTLADNSSMSASLIIAADGINSFARTALFPSQPSFHHALPTSFAAYRLTAKVSTLLADPLTSPLVDLESHSTHLYAAHNVSCMTYVMCGATLLNIVLSHPDNPKTTPKDSAQYLDTITQLFQHFPPIVRRLLELCDKDNINNYPVFAVPKLPTWTHESARFVLLGDAAHAMVFYLSMGVSMAVEDAAALSEALKLAFTENIGASRDGEDGWAEVSELKAPDEEGQTKTIRKALEVFQAVRKPRCEAVADSALRAGKVLHLQDGRERQLRDQALRAAERNDYWPLDQEPLGDDERKLMREWVYGIADRETRDWCYGYDAVDALREHWKTTIENEW